jgi:hypothetical protein
MNPLRLLLLLLISGFAQADPNGFDPNDLKDFTSHWLEPAVTATKVYYIPSEGEPNNLNKLLKIVQERVVHRLDLTDFVFLAQRWEGDPNYIPPVETPTMPQDANEPEPNEVQATVRFCFTIGGKHHLFEDCRYILGKEYKPCLCDPNNMCLTCAARVVTR